jgi:hypothetical protein
MDISLMLEGMRETIPQVISSFTDDYCAELSGRLKRRTGEFPAPEDQQALAAIITSLDDRTEKRTEASATGRGVAGP